jgi:hypothetical protein
MHDRGDIAGIDGFLAVIQESWREYFPNATKAQRDATEQFVRQYESLVLGHRVKVGSQHRDDCAGWVDVTASRIDYRKCDCPARLTLEFPFGRVTVEVTGDVIRDWVVVEEN